MAIPKEEDVLPWKETSVESERLQFIERYCAGEETVAELCRRFGISRKTGYKLIDRYEAYGEGGLLDLSRAPHHHPNATPTQVAERIVEAKRKRPTWGPKKIVARLRSIEPEVLWPSPSTASGILDRAGLVRRRKRRRRATSWGEPFAHAQHPNDVWSIDLKGWFRTGDGKRIDPLTAQDAMSRYLLVCDGLDRPTGPEVKRSLERAFREYGLPRVIRTDNGPPFASVGLGSLTPLSAWWVKLGIVPERIEPGHPEQNGRLERLHRTLKADTATPPEATRRRQRRALDHFRHSYNVERPHEALGQRPPSLLYVPSFKPYPARLSSPQYGAGVTVRSVRSNGEIKWKGDLVYVSETLKGEPIGLVPQDDCRWTVHFGPLLIGLLDDQTKRIAKTPVKVLPMSPV
jgi:transposase InsO family protein